jgi:hypothetical protein
MPSTTRQRLSRTSKRHFQRYSKGRPSGRPFFYGWPKWYFGQVRKKLFALLLLGACQDKRPPVPTEEQSVQLNDAEDMLNDMAHNEEGPADRSASPSNQSE